MLAKSKSILNLLVTFLLITPIWAHSQGSSIVKGGIGWMAVKNAKQSFSKGERFDNGYCGRISLTQLFTPFVGVEVEGTFALTKTKTANSATNNKKSNIVPLSGLLQLRIPIKNAMVPYIGVGGAYRMIINTPTSVKIKPGAGFTYQAGLDFFLLDNLGINLDVKRTTIKHRVSDTNVSTSRFKTKITTVITTIGLAIPF